MLRSGWRALHALYRCIKRLAQHHMADQRCNKKGGRIITSARQSALSSRQIGAVKNSAMALAPGKARSRYSRPSLSLKPSPEYLGKQRRHGAIGGASWRVSKRKAHAPPSARGSSAYRAWLRRASWIGGSSHHLAVARSPWFRVRATGAANVASCRLSFTHTHTHTLAATRTLTHTRYTHTTRGRLSVAWLRNVNRRRQSQQHIDMFGLWALALGGGLAEHDINIENDSAAAARSCIARRHGRRAPANTAISELGISGGVSGGEKYRKMAGGGSRKL